MFTSIKNHFLVKPRDRNHRLTQFLHPEKRSHDIAMQTSTKLYDCDDCGVFV